MPLRRLTPKEIESFIEDDSIVWVTCRNPAIPLTQGKFIKGKAPLKGGSGEFPYSFCSFKKGIKTGFLPAREWLLDDQNSTTEHQETVSNVLSQMFPKKR